MTKVFLWPDYGDAPDPGDGGVRRVVEAQRRYLPQFGVEVVNSPEDADVINAHMTAPDTLLRNYQGKPLVASNHGFYWQGYDWGEWAEKANADVMRLVRAADAVTAPSEWVANIIRRHSNRPVTAIYHGIELPEPQLENDGYVLWNKTRVDPICDARPLRELAARLPGVRFQSTFWQDGDHDRDRLWPDNVEVTGKLPHLDALRAVQRAGVYLATSRETFGIGTLEAMAAGVPVVGFNFGGQAEVITHGRDGYLARPGDYDDLAAGVRWALSYRDTVGEWARETAESYRWETFIEQYAAIFHRLQAHREKPKPRVSIIVTAYGLARYLPAALDSIHTQAETDWECIVVDDASPDECGAIADEYAQADPRFKVIHNETNVYLAEARNIGIRAAQADYVLPLDADDMLTPNTLTLLADALDRDRLTHVTYGNVRFTDEDGETPTRYGQHDAGHSGWPVAFDIDLMLAGPGQPMPYASMFRRTAWEWTGGYRRRVKSSEDCDLWLRLSSYGFTARMVTTADTLVYRNRPDSMSRTEGWSDAENRTWYPWIKHRQLMPACGAPPGARSLKVLDVDPPRIAVIIPVGPGHEKYVLTAIDSVDAQVFREWECIVVADGVQLPELPSWVRVIEQPFNAGVAASRNAGIAAARAPLFLCLDADDYLLPDAILTLYAAHLQNKDGRDVVYADFWEDPTTPGVFKSYQLADYDPRMLLKGGLPATSLVPKAAWAEVGGYESNVPWEDWDFQLKLAAAGWCGLRVPRPIWVYRKHTGARRSDHYSRRKEAEAVMLGRWGEYINGGKELMACASCGGRAKPAVRESRGPMAAASAPNGPAAVRIRYLGDQAGNINWSVSRADGGTGTVYWFSAREPVKYVLVPDAEFLLTKSMFAPVDDELLAPAGAPVAVAAMAAAPSLLSHERVEQRPAVGAVRVTGDEEEDLSTRPKTLADLPPEAIEETAAATPPPEPMLPPPPPRP